MVKKLKIIPNIKTVKRENIKKYERKASIAIFAKTQHHGCKN